MRDADDLGEEAPAWARRPHKVPGLVAAANATRVRPVVEREALKRREMALQPYSSRLVQGRVGRSFLGSDLLNSGQRDDRLEPRADVNQPVGGLPVKTAN